MTDADWQDHAACIDHDPRWWFPENHGGPDSYRNARRICAFCPVRADCLDYALRECINHGMWGGKTPRELRGLRNKARAEGRQSTLTG